MKPDKNSEKLAILILKLGMKTTVGEIMDKKKREPDFFLFLDDLEINLGNAIRRQAG